MVCRSFSPSCNKFWWFLFLLRLMSWQFRLFVSIEVSFSDTEESLSALLKPEENSQAGIAARLVYIGFESLIWPCAFLQLILFSEGLLSEEDWWNKYKYMVNGSKGREMKLQIGYVRTQEGPYEKALWTELDLTLLDKGEAFSGNE